MCHKVRAKCSRNAGFQCHSGSVGAKWVKMGHVWSNVGHGSCPGHVEGFVGHVGSMGHVDHWASEFM